MRIEQRHWTRAAGWTSRTAPAGAELQPQLVFAFGSAPCFEESRWLEELTRAFPAATTFGCSTAGEILGSQVHDESVAATAVQFEHTTLRLAQVRLREARSSAEAGATLARALAADDLVHVLVLSDGISVNGSKLAQGLAAHLPAHVSVTGGLAADGDRFQQTFVVAGAPPAPGLTAAVGFYGQRLQVGCGSMGGWDPFGPERLVTQATGNVLYELDGKSALGLYRLYLGPHAANLPASGLLFPLAIRPPDGGPAVVRSIVGIDEANRSLIFAGDVPEGSYARLMKASVDHLVDGAADAARTARGSGSPALALLVSCVGRRLVLKQRAEEELESVREVVGETAALAGFYAYGEISPFGSSTSCELHNQTMTITTFSER